MERTTPWLALALGVLAAGGLWFYRAGHPAGATGADARAMVERAWTSESRVAFSGEQTIRMSGIEAPVRARVLQAADGSKRIDYLTPPLTGVQVWESKTRTYRFNPKLKRLTVSRRRTSLEDVQQQERQLLANYTARIIGTEEVADRPVTVVELRSRSHTDRVKRVWIDPKTYVILGSEDANGPNLLRRTKFTRIAYLAPGAEPKPSELLPSEELVRKYGTALVGDTSARFEPAQLSKLVGFPVHAPKTLPEGYTFQGAYQMPCLCGGRHQAARLEFSDGLNTVSLFECGHPECDADRTRLKRPVSPLAVRLSKDSYYYLAVGDAPRADLEKIVQSAAE
jgi:hypothetical protein